MINEPSLTQLGSWRLTAVLHVPVETWIGNAAAVLSGAWGAVTRRAHQSGYSRTAVYTHAQRVVQAVASRRPGGTKTSGSKQKPTPCGRRGLKPRSSVRPSNVPSRAPAVPWA